MSTDQSNTIKIAVLETEMKGLREQQKSHAEETKVAIANVAKDVKDVMAIMNRGKGAYTASLVIAGGIGAFMLKLFGMIGIGK